MIFPFIVINTQSSVFTTTPHSQQIILASSRTQSVEAAHTASDVPFYSQFVDISAPAWKKVGCGIASLAMIIDFYKPAVPVNTLLTRGIAAGAYTQNAGWSYKGLIALAQKYGLEGASYDLSKLGTNVALKKFKTLLNDGPVIASVHYKFDPHSSIPHLVVINRIEDDTLYYNDPAAKSGDKQISVTDFERGWKMRFIVFRPVVEKESGASV